jgi:hypothetical protein
MWPLFLYLNVRGDLICSPMSQVPAQFTLVDSHGLLYGGTAASTVDINPKVNIPDLLQAIKAEFEGVLDNILPLRFQVNPYEYKNWNI